MIKLAFFTKKSVMHDTRIEMQQTFPLKKMHPTF